MWGIVKSEWDFVTFTQVVKSYQLDRRMAYNGMWYNMLSCYRKSCRL